MIFYLRCSLCHHQEKREGDYLGNFKCALCESNVVDLYSGRAPMWWIDGEECPASVEPAPVERTFKVQFTPADPFFIAGAIYAAFTVNPWWLLVVPLVVGSWFFNPRWNKAEGWRFYHGGK